MGALLGRFKRSRPALEYELRLAKRSRVPVVLLDRLRVALVFFEFALMVLFGPFMIPMLLAVLLLIPLLNDRKRCISFILQLSISMANRSWYAS